MAKRCLWSVGSESINCSAVDTPCFCRKPSRVCEPHRDPSGCNPANREKSPNIPSGRLNCGLLCRVSSSSSSSSSNSRAGRLCSWLPSRWSVFRSSSSSNTPCGSPVRSLPDRSSVSRRTRPSKSPTLRLEIPWFDRLREVISRMRRSVMSSQVAAPLALMIASRTSSVRSHTSCPTPGGVRARFSWA